MPKTYPPEFRKKIIRLHEEEGRSIKSIHEEYGISKSIISKWCNDFLKQSCTNPEVREEYERIQEMVQLQREMDRLRISHFR